MKRINIIGCGRAAGSLAGLWVLADSVQIGCIMNRYESSTQRAVEKLGAGRAVTRIADMAPADYWLIGTSDHQIDKAAAALARERDDLGGGLVFHLAGRFGVDILQALQGSGAKRAALHPVRSLTHRKVPLEVFEGTACVAEGNEAALAMLQPLVSSIGGNWLPVDRIDRGLYHAAVAMVSNVTKAVAWKAQTWQVQAGLPEDTASAVTNQLLNSTVDDLFRAGARQSITGPVVRGDTRTIEAHLAAVQDSYPEDIDIYRILARTVFDLALDRGDLDAETQQRFRELLKKV